MRRLLALALVGVLAGCGQLEDTRVAGDRAAMQGSVNSMDMQGMDEGGMRGMSGIMGVMSGMRTHMDSMMRSSPERLKAMIADHERMMAEMMDRMGADMRSMNMAGGRNWSALSDSVRRDRAELPRVQHDHEDRGNPPGAATHLVVRAQRSDSTPRRPSTPAPHTHSPAVADSVQAPHNDADHADHPPF